MILPNKAPRQFGAKKKGDVVDIIINGKKKRAEFLGSGQFANAFAVGRNDVFVYVHFGDYSKDILRDCNQSPKNFHIPKCELVEIQTGPKDATWDIRVYKMQYYWPLNALVEPAWKIFKELDRARTASLHVGADRPMIGTGRCLDINRYVIDNADVPGLLTDALEELTVNASNYGDFLFDFQKKNMAIDKCYRLVLLDPMFDAKLLHDDIKTRLGR